MNALLQSNIPVDGALQEWGVVFEQPKRAAVLGVEGKD